MQLEELAARVEGAQIAVEVHGERLPELEAAWRARPGCCQCGACAHHGSPAADRAGIGPRAQCRRHPGQSGRAARAPAAGAQCAEPARQRHARQPAAAARRKAAGARRTDAGCWTTPPSRQDTVEAERRQANGARSSAKAPPTPSWKRAWRRCARCRTACRPRARSSPGCKSTSWPTCRACGRSSHVEAGWETALEAVLRERTGALEMSNLDWAKAFFNDAPPAQAGAVRAVARRRTCIRHRPA